MMLILIQVLLVQSACIVWIFAAFKKKKKKSLLSCNPTCVGITRQTFQEVAESWGWNPHKWEWRSREVYFLFDPFVTWRYSIKVPSIIKSRTLNIPFLLRSWSWTSSLQKYELLTCCLSVFKSKVFFFLLQLSKQRFNPFNPFMFSPSALNTICDYL